MRVLRSIFTTTKKEPTRPRRLSADTQIIPMQEIANALCRCGRKLTWAVIDTEKHGDAYTNEAECRCGMSYFAGQAEVKVEGIDSNLY